MHLWLSAKLLRGNASILQLYSATLLVLHLLLWLASTTRKLRHLSGYSPVAKLAPFLQLAVVMTHKLLSPAPTGVLTVPIGALSSWLPILASALHAVPNSSAILCPRIPWTTVQSLCSEKTIFSTAPTTWKLLLQ